MAKDVKFNIRLNVDGKEHVVSAVSSVRELRSAVEGANSKIRETNDVLVNFNQHVQKIQNINSAVSQLASTLNSVTEESRSFGAAMNVANTMAGKSGEDFGKMKDQVSELAKTLPMAREELANGLYQVISNGVPEDNWIEYLQKSAKASIGGVADLGETVKVTSTVIKNYGLSWEDAGAIQDKIQLTAKNGVTSFEQMAQALPRVSGNAAALGVSVDELMATFATLTGVSGNTAEVSTQLAAVFTALIKPSSEAAKMAQQMGIEFNAAAIKSAGGMQNFLQQLDASVKSYAKSSGMLEQEVYGKLFGSAESLRAIGPLTGQLADTFRENVGKMSDSAGTINDAFGNIANSGASKLQMLKNKVAGIGDAIAGTLAPVLPILNFSAQCGSSLVSVLALNRALQALAGTQMLVQARTFAVNAASAAWNAVGVRMNAIVQLVSASFRGAAVSATTMKLAIQGLMCATVIGAALAALGQVIASLMTSADDTAESMKQMGDAAQQSADEAQQAFDGTLKQTYSQLMQQYDALREKWQSLKTAHEKLQWVRNNQQAFQQLGVKVQSVADAESIFNGNTDKVVEAFKRRAKAAAYAAELANLYGQQLQLETRAADIKLSMQVVKKKYYAEGNKDKDPYFYQNVDRLAHDFAVRQDKLNGNDGDVDGVMESISTISAKINKTVEAMKQFKSDDLLTAADLGGGGGGKGGKTGGGGRTGGGKTTPKPEPKQDTRKWSEKSYDERIAALEQDIKNSKNEGLNEVLREMIADLQREKRQQLDDIACAAAEVGKQQGPKSVGGLTGTLLPQMPQKIEVPKINFPDFETEAEKIERYAQALQGLNGIDLQSFESVRQGLSSIKELTGSTATAWATAGASCQALGNAMQQMGADSEAAKAGLVMAAVGNLVLSFAQALASCKTWVEWLAFGIAGTAQLVSLVSTVSGFATGGVVGGSSTRGDKLMIGVNSGEMILNRAQQRRLFDIANGAFRLPSTGERRYNMSALQPQAVATAAQRPQTVRLEVRGSRLFGVLENTRRTSGRRYDIT